ncbi:MAG: lipoprotein insertase outer membrane protein LolB [Sterolibacterium sp.]|nr:lipoprotein insertase outer membrane protein LolB [Sterolibacterium sp.]
MSARCWLPLRTLLPVCCAGLLLSACAGLPETEIVAQPQIERPARTDIAHFGLQGRIAVRHATQRLTATLDWQHSPAADELLLSGPLGQGLVRLGRTAEGAWLQLADQRRFEAADWEVLAQQLLGMALPLSALSRCILALPLAQAGPLDQAGRLQWQQIDGWRIDYLDYESPAANALPSLLELRQGETEVRLKIDTWQLEEIAPAAAVTHAVTATGDE